VNGDEIQFGSNLLRDEARVETGAIQTPRNQADRNQVPLVMLPNSFRQLVTPLPGDFGSGTFRLIERDELHEVAAFASHKGRPQPVASFTPAPRHDWFVHQIVAKDRRAVGTSPHHRFPEPCLNIPPFFFPETIIPFGNLPITLSGRKTDKTIFSNPIRDTAAEVMRRRTVIGIRLFPEDTAILVRRMKSTWIRQNGLEERKRLPQRRWLICAGWPIFVISQFTIVIIML
jgi:hypothetical protein